MTKVHRMQIVGSIEAVAVAVMVVTSGPGPSSPEVKMPLPSGQSSRQSPSYLLPVAA